MTKNYEDMTTEDFFVDMLTRDVARYEHTIGEFAVKVAKDPLYSLSWADEVFSTAARLDITKLVLRCLAQEETPPEKRTSIPDMVAKLRVEFTDRAMRYAQYGHHSSSVCQNRGEEAKAMALVEMLRHIDSYQKQRAREAVRSTVTFKWVHLDRGLFAVNVNGEERYVVCRAGKGSRYWSACYHHGDAKEVLSNNYCTPDEAQKASEAHYVNMKIAA